MRGETLLLSGSGRVMCSSLTWPFRFIQPSPRPGEAVPLDLRQTDGLVATPMALNPVTNGNPFAPANGGASLLSSCQMRSGNRKQSRTSMPRCILTAAHQPRRTEARHVSGSPFPPLPRTERCQQPGQRACFSRLPLFCLTG
jgi:hypothetical protein